MADILKLNERKLLIFDYDGVIVDSIDIVRGIFNSLHKRYDLPKLRSRDDLRRLFNRNFYESLSEYGLSPVQSKLLLTSIKDKLIQQEDKLQLFPQMRNALSLLCEKYILAIISSNHAEAIKTILKKYQLENVFVSIAGGEETASKVDKINYLSKKLGVKKSQVFFISDTRGDIMEGKQARVNTIGVSWGYHSKQELVKEKPHYLFKTPKDLQTFFLKPH